MFRHMFLAKYKTMYIMLMSRQDTNYKLCKCTNSPLR